MTEEAACPTVGEFVTLHAPGEFHHGVTVRVTGLAEKYFHWHADGVFHPRAVDGWELRGRSEYAEIARPRPANKSSLKCIGNLTGRREQGFSGDVCTKCGSSRMVRTGSCATCQECGDSSSCG